MMTGATLARAIGFLGLTIVVILLPLFTNPYQKYILIIALINIVLAVSLRLVLATGQLSLGHAAFMAVGAYSSGLLTKGLGLCFWFAMPLGGLISAATATLLGYPTLRIKGIYFAIATFSLGEILRLLLIYFVHPFGGAEGLTNIPLPDPISIPGLPVVKFTSHTAYYYLILVITLITILTMRQLDRSKFGSAFRAIQQADVLAEHIGINITNCKVMAFAIAAFFAGIAGAFYAHFLTAISPHAFSFWVSVYALIYVVVGGMASIAGPVLGAVFLTIVPEFLRAAAAYEMVVNGLLLMLVMLFMRNGMIGLIQQVAGWVSSKVGTKSSSAEEIG